jgi:hypothetical protein
MAKKYDLKMAVIKRWLRTLLPQVPAGVAYLTGLSGTVDLPSWVVPSLMLLGTIATALDKFLREVGWYDRVMETFIQS